LIDWGLRDRAVKDATGRHRHRFRRTRHCLERHVLERERHVDAHRTPTLQHEFCRLGLPLGWLIGEFVLLVYSVLVHDLLLADQTDQLATRVEQDEGAGADCGIAAVAAVVEAAHAKARVPTPGIDHALALRPLNLDLNHQLASLLTLDIDNLEGAAVAGPDAL